MSRITPIRRRSLRRWASVTVLSGCIVSLLFPFFSAQNSFAATSDDDIESSIPGRSDDSNSDGDQTVLEGVRFACMNRGGEYTVMYQPESRPGQGFPWAIPRAMGGGWDAESRCFEIARRLEEYRPDGLLELKTGTENGYNILCVTTEDNGDCRIVLTVPPNQDPLVTRDAVFENLLTADTGTMTSGVNTYAGSDSLSNDLITVGSQLFGRKGSKRVLKARKSGIRLKPYLDRSDRGSGVALRNGIPLGSATSSGGKRLNPGRFRN